MSATLALADRTGSGILKRCAFCERPCCIPLHPLTIGALRARSGYDVIVLCNVCLLSTLQASVL